MQHCAEAGEGQSHTSHKGLCQNSEAQKQAFFPFNYETSASRIQERNFYASAVFAPVPFASRPKKKKTNTQHERTASSLSLRKAIFSR